jgi:hypothetical protein
MSKTAVLLGEGTLIVPAAERGTRRCGSVGLILPGGSRVDCVSAPVGRWGELVAVVTEAAPARSELPGERCVLGTGYLFRHYMIGNPAVGVRPADPHACPWMNSALTEDLAGCKVRLEFCYRPRNQAEALGLLISEAREYAAPGHEDDIERLLHEAFILGGDDE